MKLFSSYFILENEAPDKSFLKVWKSIQVGKSLELAPCLFDETED